MFRDGYNACGQYWIAVRLVRAGSSIALLLPSLAFAWGTRKPWCITHARKAEKLMTLIAIPAYDPINIVKIILIINYPMDVWVIKACFSFMLNIGPLRLEL